MLGAEDFSPKNLSSKLSKAASAASLAACVAAKAVDAEDADVEASPALLVAVLA